MKYELNHELKNIARLKIPAHRHLFPMMNRIVGLSTCRSDQAVIVKSYQTPGYRGAIRNTQVIEPKNAKGKLPCMVFFHGGGFMLKASFVHHTLAKQYAKQVPCKVVYPDYRLAPKHSFPIPVEDCYEAYRWVLEHAATLNIDPNAIIVAGDSAGGNLALAVTLMAQDRGIHIPDALLLIYPVTDRRMITESMKQYVDTPVWDAKLTELMWKVYLGDQHPDKIEYASPIEAPSFAQFPPTYIEVAQYDALHDEGMCLCHKLQNQGIECEIHDVSGACHGFEAALNSKLLKECMERRLTWLTNRIRQNR